MGRLVDLLKTGPISGFRLRTKLLLLALTTLALPWAGCQYAREMEQVLRQSEQQSLLAVTTTIAGSLKGRRELLFRADSLPGSTGSNQRDITPVVLAGAPLVDGRAEDWDTDARNLVRVAGPAGDSLRLLAATHERGCFSRCWCATASGCSMHRGSRRSISRPSAIVSGSLSMTSAAGSSGCSLPAPGRAACAAGASKPLSYGREQAVEEPRIEGVWQRSPDGWVLEIAIPLSMVGQHLGVLIDDRDRRGAPRASYGTLEASDLRATGRLIAASPDLNDHLRQFAQPGVELTVASSTGAVLTRLDAPALPGDYTRLRGFLPRMYRIFLDGGANPRSVSQAGRERAVQTLTERASQGTPSTELFAGRYREQRDRRRGSADLFRRRHARSSE